jgi:dUTP pyrophosphatase
MEKFLLKVKKLAPDAICPTRKQGDVGYDLYAHAIERLDHGLVKVSTGIAIQLPPGIWAKIECRSSLGAKGFDVHGGVIDNGYRGPIICILNHHSSDDPCGLLQVGDKIAQLTLHQQDITEIEEVDELDESERGSNGFGSTGR